MECIKMTKWSWYHVKTSELEKLSSIIPRDVTSYFSQFVKKISSPCENGLYVYTLSPSQTCVYGSFLYDQDKKGRQNSKISSLFRSSWNTDNSSGKGGRGFPKINT